MFKVTPKKRVLFVRRFIPVWIAVFGVFSLTVSLWPGSHTPKAFATASSTINFQARLQTSTGAIVPDGTYNVEFQLWSTTSGGSALWTEDYLNSASHGLTTKNGYLSANLGSLTAFPGSIDWSQQLYLTMNIGGTGSSITQAYDTNSSGWDGRMDPRLALTAQPYAFQAANAAKATELSSVTGGNTSTLTIQGSGSNVQNFVVPDQGAGGTYHLLTNEAAANAYIQLQTGTPVQQTGAISISGAITAGSMLSNTIDRATAGTLTIGGSTATGISLGANTSLAAGKTFTNNGATVNTTLGLSNFATGGYIGSAASTVDIYTGIAVAQTTTGQTLQIHDPTASAAYGRVIYISNVGTADFSMLGMTVRAGSTVTLVWTSAGTWQYAGADGGSILNQTAITQTANFKISGTATAGSFVGDGSQITAINASNISSGTVDDSRLSANVAKYDDTTANFTGTLQQSGNDVCDTSNNCGDVQFATGNVQSTSSNNALIGLYTSGTGDLIDLYSDNGAFTIDNSGNINTTGAVKATALNAYGYATSDTVGTYNGEYTKLGSCTLSNQYEDCRAELNLVSGNDGGSLSRATVDIRVKQQNPLGSAPYVALDASNVNNTGGVDGLFASDFTAVPTYVKGDGTVVELWMRVNANWTNYRFEPILNNGDQFTWFENQGYQVALPSVDTSSDAFTTAAVADYATQNVSGLSVEGTEVISGSGALQNAALTGTYSSALTFSSTSNSYAGTWNGNAIAVTKGGTGLTSGPSANGQLLIGHSDGTYSLATITAGTGISVTNGAGSITINSTITQGVTTVGTWSDTNHYANGASISSTTLTLGAADASNPGLVTTGTQTFAGAKTFGSTLSAGGALTVSAGGANITGGVTVATGNLSVSSGTITASSTVQGTQFISTISTGTAPFTVSSTTKVTNLNADQLDGIDSTGFLQTSTSFSGDVSGAYNATSVDKLKGTALSISSLTNTNMLVYNGTNWVNKSLSGDATMDNTGALTIATGAVTSAKILDGTIATGDLADSSVTSAKIANGTVTGGASGDIASATIDNSNLASGSYSAITSANSLTSASSLVTVGALTSGSINWSGGIVTTGSIQGANVTVGSGGVFTNGGATVNTTLALSNFATGGSIGSAASTVDVYTAISVNQTTASQTLTIPSPTASTTYGRLLYVSNIGTADFTISGTPLRAGATTTLIWTNTNGGASWQFAGTDGSGILNQNGGTQTANFLISGTGQANTSILTPLLDTSSATTLNIATGNANAVNIATNASAHTIAIGNGAAAQTVTVGSTNTTSTLTLQGGSGGVAVTASGGAIVLTAGAASSFLTANTSGTASAGITIQSGDASSSSASGNVSIDTGSFTAGTPTVSIGGVHAKTVTIGNTGSLTSLNLNIGAGTLNVGTTAANKTVNIGAGGSTANTTTVHIADSTGAAQTVTVGSTNTSSTTTINGGNGVTIATNGSSAGVLIQSANSATAFQVQNSSNASLLTVDTSANAITFGSAAGSGLFKNNGATVNTVLALTNFSSGGSIGTAAATVDVYTAISVNQTTASQTLTVPTPTAGTTYGRLLYLTNIGTADFTINSVIIRAGSTATLIWSNTNTTPSWQFAGADGSSILNQTSNTQSAGFTINGTGTAATFTAGTFSSSSNLILQAASGNNITISPGAAGGGSGTLNLAINAATLNIGNGSNNVRTIAIGNTGGSQAQTITIGNNTSSTSTTTIQGANGVTINTNSNSAGVLVQSTANSATAFQVQNSTNGKLLTVDTANTAITFGNAAGSGSVTNNGATINSTLALSNFASGGSIGSAASTVDVYTAISVAQTTASQTLTVPSPTSSTAYGRMLYLSNIGTADFTVSGMILRAGTTTSLIWANTNGAASWQFAGADGSGILNQSSAAQTANFLISGTGQANTSILTPLLDTATGVALNIGTTHATSISLNQNTTVASNKSFTANGSALFQDATNSTTAFQVQNASGTAVLGVDTASAQVSIGQSSTNITTLMTDSSGNFNVSPSGGTIIFATNAYSDQFSSTSLGSGWTYTDSVGGSTYSLTNSAGHLQIPLTTSASHDCWASTTTCARMMRSVSNSDAVYTTKIDGTNLVNTASHGYGIMLWQDSTNFLRFEYHADGGNITASAYSIIANSGATQLATSGITMQTSNYLRVIKTGTSYTFAYGSDGVSWTTVGTFTAGITISQAGLYAGNAGSNPATTANFDYFTVATNANLQVSGNALFQGTTNSTTAFQVQNAGGATVLGVDTATTSTGCVWVRTDGCGTGANGMYVDWKSGDTLATFGAGSSNSSNNQIAVNAVSYSGYGINGFSSTNTGIYGSTAGTFATGVTGYASATTGFSTGVYGITGAAGGSGVLGEAYDASGSSGIGVSGKSDSNGIGVKGASNTGISGYFQSTSSTTTGAAATLVVQQNSSSANNLIQAQASGGAALFTVTSDEHVYIGPSAGDTTGALLVLGTKTNSGNPAGVNGAMYYNESLQEYLCFRTISSTESDGDWEPCGINPIDRGFAMQDEFMSGVGSSYPAINGSVTGISSNNWSDTVFSAGANQGCNNFAFNSASVNAGLQPTANRPGVMSWRATANNSSGCAFYMGSSTGGGSMYLAAGDVVKTAIGVDNTTQLIARVGMTTQVDGTAPTTGVWWEANPTTSSHWLFCYYNGGAQCSDSSGTTPSITANTFVTLEIRINSLGSGTSSVDYFINGTKYSVTSTTVASATAVYPTIVGMTSAAQAGTRTFAVDYYQIRGYASTQR